MGFGDVDRRARSQILLEPLDLIATGQKLTDPRQQHMDILTESFSSHLLQRDQASSESMEHRMNALLCQFFKRPEKNQDAELDWLLYLDDVSQRAQLQRFMEGASEHLHRGAQVALPSAAERLQAAKANQRLKFDSQEANAPVLDKSCILSRVNLECPEDKEVMQKKKSNNRRSRSCGLPSKSNSKVRIASSQNKNRPVFKGTGSGHAFNDEFPLELLAKMECMNINLEAGSPSCTEQGQPRTITPLPRQEMAFGKDVSPSAKSKKKSSSFVALKGDHIDDTTSTPNAFGARVADMTDILGASSMTSSGGIFDGSELPTELSVSSSFQSQTLNYPSRQSCPWSAFDRPMSSHVLVREKNSGKSHCSGVASASRATTDYVNICQSVGSGITSTAEQSEDQAKRPHRFLVYGQDSEADSSFEGVAQSPLGSAFGPIDFDDRPQSAASIMSSGIIGRRGGPLNDVFFESTTPTPTQSQTMNPSRSLPRETSQDIGVLFGSMLISQDPLLQARSTPMKERVSGAAHLHPGIRARQKARRLEKANGSPS